MAQLEYTNVFDSNYNVDTCSKCGTETYIMNCTHYLCNTCNCQRLHGKTPAELQKIKQETYRARQLKKSKAKAENAPQGEKKHVPKIRIKQVSEKQRQINAAMSEMKRDIVEHAINTNQYYCHGCNVQTLKLDCSHKLSIAQRTDLALKKKNITLLCRKCHVIWESWDISQMIELNCFVEDLEYIHKKDPKTFNKIFFKLLDYYNLNKYPSVLKIIKRIEQFEQIEVEA